MDLRNYGRDIKDFVWKIEEILSGFLIESSVLKLPGRK